MFGYPVRVSVEDLGIILRPPKKSEMGTLSELFSSMVIHMYTMGMNSVTEEDELDWWDKTRKDKESAIWAIVPDNCEEAVGITGLHGIHTSWGCCTSGIIIFNRNFWGKGVAYRAHLARTWYAVNVLNRLTIQSAVRVPNEASLKALLKVGYRVTGKYDRNVFRNGCYLDTYLLSWTNPYRTDLLYPQGVPEELSESLIRASSALELANSSVSYM